MSRRNPVPFPYVPEYIEGELLFSWIARLHLLNAHGSHRDTLLRVFGSTTSIPSADIPSRLQPFVELTASWGPFASLSTALRESTLFPYYARFLSEDRRRAAEESIACGSAGSLKLSLGLVANRLGASTTFRTCAKCDSKNVARYGCTPLLRIHHLPGVSVCAIHGEPLFEHVRQSRLAHRQRLTIVRENRRRIPCTKSDSKIPLLIAKLSKDALEVDAAATPPEVRSRIYLAAISARGFGSGRRTDWSKLARAVCAHYDNFDGLAFRERLLSTTAWPLRWLHDMCTRPERSVHPLCHLLLIGFLFGRLSRFLEAVREDSRAPAEAGSTPPDEIPSPSCATRRAVIADSSLSCRKASEKLGLSVNTVVTLRRSFGMAISERRKTITSQKLSEIEKLLRQGTSVAEVAERCAVSLSSIYRHLAGTPDVAEMRRELSQSQALDRRRAEWLAALARDDTGGVKKLRYEFGAAYAWLYRHDREWLFANSPRKASDRLPRVDWRRRDASFADAVRASQNDGRLSNPRRSLTSLLRSTGSEATARRNIDRLPQLFDALIDLSESDSKFCERRYAAAKVDLQASGYETPEPWRVLRAARLRKRANSPFP